MKKLVFDVDGVLADFTPLMFAAVNAVFPGRTPEGSIPNKWSWSEFVTGEEFGRAWAEFKEGKNVWETAPPLPGAAQLGLAIDAGLLESAELFFVTSRTPTAGRSPAMQTYNWLRENVSPGVEHCQVVVVEHFVNKVDVVRAIGADFSVDDNAPTVIMLDKVGGKHKSYLFSQPWNVYEEEAYGLKAVHSVNEFFVKCALASGPIGFDSKSWPAR